jgi:predicted ATPase
VTKLPTGTVTFLFTDVEGSTRLLQELGDRYVELLADHRRVLRSAFARHGGVEVDTQGDAFFVAFAKASDALAAAAEGRDALADSPIRVRMGLHTGEPLFTDEGYAGIDVHRAARIAAAGHGGQILVSESTHQLVSDNGLRDLGEHRLKDLTAPERVYQLGEGDFPPLRSLNQTNLPVQPAPLVGRARELQETKALLQSTRMLTLTGAGGSGKTRLALQIAADVLDEFPDGVWFVSLAAVRDPDLIEPTIAQTIGGRDELGESLRGKKLLFLLDNCEQLLPRGASVVAALPATRLVTSRERLNVSAEQEYPVTTLPLDDAVALFVERVRQLKPRFEPDEYVSEIARRVDGLPLALELAAARMKVLTTEQVVARLGHSLDLLTTGGRDAPDRQRTLRATIEWSYELLSPEEQLLFTRLAVFPGSFDLDAGQSICGADLDDLQALVDKSLIRQTEAGRFFLLETIREFAVERLQETEAENIRRVHVAYFQTLVDQASPQLWSADRLERLEREHDNLRAALATMLADEQVEPLLRFVGGLWKLWSVHGHWHEGRRWLDSAIALSASHRSSSRAHALEGAADIAWRQGDYDAGRAYLDESLALWRELGDRRGVTSSLHFRANLEAATGNTREARKLWTEAQQSWRELGDSERFAATVFNLGLAAFAEGELAEATAQFEESLGLAQREGLEILAALSRHSLGLALLRLKREEEGVVLLRQALQAHRGFGEKEGIVICLLGLAEAAELAGRFNRAARLVGAAERLKDEIGFSFQADLARDHERLTRALASHLGDVGFPGARDEGRELGLEQSVEYALAEID